MTSNEGSTQRSLKTVLAVLILLGSSLAGSPNFSIQSYPGRANVISQIHANLNNDSQQDLITASASSSVITTYLGRGAGDYAPGVDHAINTPNGSVALATGDLDKDGKADILVTNGTNILTIFYGNNDGTFVRQDYTLPTPNVAFSAVVTDVNRDGKPDVVLNVQSDTAFQLRLFEGTGARASFGSNYVIYSQLWQPITQVLTGDFDGDAKADLAVVDGACYRGGGCNGDLNLLYGDGLGGFAIFRYPVTGMNTWVAADLNKDGKSDLVSTFQNGSDVPSGGVHTFTGAADRNVFNLRENTAPDSDTFYGAPAVADFDGDRINDLAITATHPTCAGCTTFVDGVYVYDGATAFATYTAVPVSTVSNFSLGPLTVSDLDGGYGNYMPDLVTSVKWDGTLKVLLNFTSPPEGFYRRCGTGTGPDFMSVCFPTSGGQANTPVQFQAFAMSFYPVRKIEIWVDGAKKSESYNNFGLQAWSDVSIPLTIGSHTATVIAANYDNRLIKKNVTFTVGSSACVQPATGSAVVICSPANGTTVHNPVLLEARGGGLVRNMEGWLDGVKQFYIPGAYVNKSYTLPAGSHRFTIFGKDANGNVLSKAVSTVTVQ